MSWRDRIAKLLTGKRPAITTVQPGPMAWPPAIGAVDSAAPRAASSSYLVTEPGAGLRHTFGDSPPMGMPARGQMNVNRGGSADVLSFEDRWGPQ